MKYLVVGDTHGTVRSVILDCNTGKEPNMAVLTLPDMTLASVHAD